MTALSDGTLRLASGVGFAYGFSSGQSNDNAWHYDTAGTDSAYNRAPAKTTLAGFATVFTDDDGSTASASASTSAASSNTFNMQTAWRPAAETDETQQSRAVPARTGAAVLRTAGPGSAGVDSDDDPSSAGRALRRRASPRAPLRWRGICSSSGPPLKCEILDDFLRLENFPRR
ncbi:MAG: hypothetical protein ACREJB_13840 [Planctomycetaceae bacterium]